MGYAADEGIDWVMLTNGRQLRLYKVIFGKPVTRHLVFDYNLADLTTIKRAASDLAYALKKNVQK